MPDPVRVQTFVGGQIAPFVPELARLRIAVFREYPYLYDGSMAYERGYLATYSACPESVFVVAFDGARVVGLSTGLPMAAETEAFKRPFLARGLDPESIFYFGESVLERAFRGRGLGVRFFEEREAYARRLGRFTHTAFCAVLRPAGHPARPPGYTPLDAFWHRRGYAKHPELTTRYAWKDLGEGEETEKPMVFWMKEMG